MADLTNTIFDPSYYLEKNTDVRDAIERMRQPGQQDNEWDWIGRFNGLLGDNGGTEEASRKFMLEPYGKWVPKSRQITDLSELTDDELARLHYDQWGSKENRKTYDEPIEPEISNPPIQNFKLDEQAKSQRSYIDEQLSNRARRFQSLLSSMY